jgi:hypothetical protein
MPEVRGTGQKNIVSFTGGEWSPLLDARVDQDKYDSACRELTNVKLLPYGGAERRAGTQYIAATKNSATEDSILIGYQFSLTTSFIIEIGGGYMRFFSNGVPVTSGGDPDAVLTGTVPYTAADLYDIQYKQINDILYLVHPSHPPQKLIRTADDDWTISQVAYTVPALRDLNTTTTTLTPSVTTGSGFLDASANLFESTDVGGFWMVSHVRDSVDTTLALDTIGTTQSTEITARGEVSFVTSGRWSGTARVQAQDPVTLAWETLREFTSIDASLNADAVIEEDELPVDTQMRIEFESSGATPTAGASPARAHLIVPSQSIEGIAEITGFVNATRVNMTVATDFESNTASTVWREAAWSPRQGYPAAITMYEQRIVYGGTSLRPQTIWGTATGEFETFRRGTDDDDAIIFTLADGEQNRIQWMEGQNKLLIGTASSEWTMAGDAEKPLTPSNVSVARQSTYGSKHIQGIMVGDAVYFVQRNGRKLRQMIESETSITARYVSPDLTLASEHITSGEILQATHVQQPHATYWAVTGDGDLISMTTEKDEQVHGWSKHRTPGASGTFESVATVFGTAGDEIWTIVKRTINGGTVRYVERINPTVWTDKDDAFYVDSGITYSGVATNTISGLDHLEGETVQILGDGDVLPDQVVSSGSITLADSQTAETAQVGLAYESVITPMKLDADSRLGAYMSTKLRIRKIIVRFYNSLGISYATNIEDPTPTFTQFPFRDTGDDMDSSPPLFSGDKEIVVRARYGTEGNVTIKQTQPLPMTILALIKKLKVTGR